MRKIPFVGIELTSQRVRGYMVPLSYRGDRFTWKLIVCYFFSSLSLLLFVFLGCSDGMEREACVCDHGFERSDLCAEIIIIIIIYGLRISNYNKLVISKIK